LIILAAAPFLVHLFAMSEHHATVRWQRTGDEFLKGRYSREHEWHFDGGAVIAASPSPSIVPAPYSNAASVDPEEAYVASLASCHMLFFLDFARRAGFQVDRYEDQATGHLAKESDGKMWISKVELRPAIAYSGQKQPTPEEQGQLHEQAHHACFIANSVKTEVGVVR
jgi:organic hydroperoxide reductase OsmC/OhrA